MPYHPGALENSMCTLYSSSISRFNNIQINNKTYAKIVNTDYAVHQLFFLNYEWLVYIYSALSVIRRIVYVSLYYCY